MNPHKAPVIGMLLVAALLLISSLGAGVQAASWHTIQTDIQSTNVLYPVMVWDGGGADNLASTAANWVGDAAPYEGCIIIFNGTSTKACTWDITAKMQELHIYSTYTSTVTQSSVMHINKFIHEGTGFCGASIGGVGLNIYESIYKSVSAGWTSNKGNLILHNATVSMHNFPVVATITVPTGSSSTITASIHSRGNVVVNGALFINPSIQLVVDWEGATGLSGSGTIDNDGTINFRVYKSNRNFNFGGDIGGTFTITNYNSASVSVLLIYAIKFDTIIVNGAANYTSTLDQNGHTITANTITIKSNGVYKNTGALGSITYFDKFTVESGGSIDGSKLYMYILPSGTLNVPSGTSIYRVYFKTYAGGTITNPITATNQFRFGFLQSNTYYKVLVNGIRSSSLYGTSDATGNLVFGSGSQSAGTYTLMSGADAWHSIQSDSQIGFTFAVTTWHIIQNDSKSMYFDPYDFHTIQADSIEYRIGQLVHAQYFNGTIESSGLAPVIQPGSNTEGNVMGIIWLLIFFIPAIILFAYLGKLGGTLGLVIMSVISVMAFDMGIFIMIVGIISSVIIMVESDGGD